MSPRAEPSRSLRLTADGRLEGSDLLGDPALLHLFDLLDRDGEEARVVGGAVRNALLGLPGGDIDVATTALPQDVLERARAARFRAIPTGIAHGTVTVLIGKAAFEVTTLREDVETDGRHAVVRFGRDFRADAQRRDFTINALSLDRDGRVHDTTGGVADLAAGCVRFIGAAEQRIREDFLRILRLFRFHAAYGIGDLDPEGLAAATRHRDALSRLSRERIRAELLKLLAAPGAVPVVRRMDEAGIAAIVLAGQSRPERLARLAAFEAACGEEPDPLLRLGALAVAGTGEADKLREVLRLSNGEHDRLSAAIAARSALSADAPPDPDALRALLFGYGRQASCDGLRLALADRPGVDPDPWRAALAFLATETEPKLPLGGSDVLARGVRSGRAVGAVLKRLQAAWIRAGFPKDPVSLANLLDAAITAEDAVDPPAHRD